MKRIANYGIGLVLLLGFAGIPASAQNQTQSNSDSAASPSLAITRARYARILTPRANPRYSITTICLGKTNSRLLAHRQSPPPIFAEQKQAESANASAGTEPRPQRARSRYQGRQTA